MTIEEDARRGIYPEPPKGSPRPLGACVSQPQLDDNIPKQKVRDAIIQHLPDHRTLLCQGSCPICKFKKELGL